MMHERTQEDLPFDSSETAAGVAEGRAVPSRFTLKRLLGRGSCGAVHEALLNLPEGGTLPVALRISEDQDQEIGAQLRQWVETAAGKSWPHIALPREFVASSAGRILVYDFLPGASLSELLRRTRRIGRPVTLELVVELLSQALEGLKCLAEQSPALLHRSIKPSNLHVGQNGQVTLLDLGIFNAALLPGNRSRGLAVSGTLPYLSPEQLNEPVKLTSAADLYALGTVAYEMLAGRPLFDGSTARREFEIRAGFGVKEKLAALEQSYPGVEACLKPALAVNPKDRYASAEVWLAALAPSRSDRGRQELARWAGELLALSDPGLPTRATGSTTAATTQVTARAVSVRDGAARDVSARDGAVGAVVSGASSVRGTAQGAVASAASPVVSSVRVSAGATQRSVDVPVPARSPARTSGVRQPSVSSAYGTRPAVGGVEASPSVPSIPAAPAASPVKVGVVLASLLMAMAALWYADQGGPMARVPSNKPVDQALHVSERIKSP